MQADCGPAKVRDFWVIVGGRRARDFEALFGTNRVAVRSPFPQVAELPGFAVPQQVYMLDLEWVSEQGRRDALVQFIAGRFGQDAADVDRLLEQEGMPILAANTTLCIEHPQRWLT